MECSLSAMSKKLRFYINYRIYLEQVKLFFTK